MCEWNVFLVKGGKKKSVMEEASFIKDDGREIIVSGTFGEIRKLKGRIVEIDSDRHEVLISCDEKPGPEK